MPSKRTPLQIRHQAALKLLAAGELDPYEALSLVCWPREGSRLEDEHVPRNQQHYSEELREELRRRHHEQGETIPGLAQATGIPYATVKMLVNEEAYLEQRAARKRARDIRRWRETGEIALECLDHARHVQPRDPDAERDGGGAGRRPARAR